MPNNSSPAPPMNVTQQMSASVPLYSSSIWKPQPSGDGGPAFQKELNVTLDFSRSYEILDGHRNEDENISLIGRKGKFTSRLE